MRRPQLSLFIFLFSLFLLLLPIHLFSQESRAPLPAGFRDILLGNDLEEVKEKLRGNGYFVYRGDPDVTLLPGENRTLIETAGGNYIKQGIFQFNKERLYIIILRLNQERVRFYTMFTTLQEKYGEPDSLTPEEVVWENNKVRLSLEKPLQVKYILKEVFTSLLENSRAEESMQELQRKRFLESF